MKFKTHLLFLSFVLLAFNSQAQSPKINRIDPPFWWNNLQEKELQLCVYGSNVALFEVQSKTPSVRLVKTEKVENPNYLFVYLNLDSFSGEEILLDFSFKGKHFLQNYQTKKLEKQYQAIDEKDILYLVFPDRFANGNPANDTHKKLNEKTSYRDSLGARHGGDLAGILQHLDYIKEMGNTALWLNPTLINDEDAYSYHGYALTDHYLTDPRIGTNADYQKLGSELHQKNMKLVMDLVPNHVGIKHWMVLDPPQKNWLNQWPSFTRTNYRATTKNDPYASEFDKKKMEDGWFDGHMPDLNQRNPLLATYLMQSYLWWINYAGIDGFRIDTYSYNDFDFMNKCLKYIKNEYPDFWTTGEIWEQAGVMHMAAYTEKNAFTKAPAGAELTSAIDFHLYWAMLEAMNQDPKWDGGLAKVYYVLSQDGLYHQPYKNLIFLDNHDINRIYTELKSDYNKWKLAMTMMFTLRGIPCLYYGTELLFSNPIPRTNDGQIRQDFPGGWAGDSLNKFTISGRTPLEQNAFEFTKKLIVLRRSKSVLTTGKTMQFTPEENHYVYFRYNDTSSIMVIVNRGNQTLELNTDRFAERMLNFKSGYDHFHEQSILDLKKIIIPANSCRMIELKP